MGSTFSNLSGSSKESLHAEASKYVFHPHPAKGLKYPGNVRQFMVKSKNGNMIEVVCMQPANRSCLTNKTIVWSHANGCINEDMYSYLQLLSEQFLIKVVSYDYQGYGNSQGECNEQNCYDDLEAVVNHFMKEENVKMGDIYLFGHSLGTGIVIEYAVNHNWQNRIVLISPYESMLRVAANESIANVSSSVDMFNTKSKLSKIQCPVKLYHGKNDTLIKVEHSENLFKALPNKTLKPTWFDHCGHNDILERIKLDELMAIIYN